MTNHRRRTFRPPLETRIRWTPKGIEWRFGLKDAIIVDRTNVPDLTPGIMKSKWWSSTDKLRDRLQNTEQRYRSLLEQFQQEAAIQNRKLVQIVEVVNGSW